MNLGELDDRSLMANTILLVQKEREILTQVLWHLFEIDRRKVFSPRYTSPRYTSLSDYMIRGLGYPADQAFRRIAAMRLLSANPQIEPKISNGSLSLTTLGLAERFFRVENSTDEEKIEILRQLEDKSTREVARILVCKSSDPIRLQPETIRPVSETMNEVKIFVSDDVIAKISLLKGLVAHKHPSISIGDVIALALDMALEHLDKTREPARRDSSAQVRRPPEHVQRPGHRRHPVQLERRKNKRHVSATMKRKIWQRAGSRCEACGSKYKLEIDHKQPFALGGMTVEENLRLLCRSCNQRAAIEIFGIGPVADRRRNVSR